MHPQISRRLAITLACAGLLSALGGAAARAAFQPRSDSSPGYLVLDASGTVPSSGYFASGDRLLTATGTFITTGGITADAGCSQKVTASGATAWAPWPGLVSWYSVPPTYLPITWTAENPDANGCDPAHVYSATVSVPDAGYRRGPAVFKLNNSYWKMSTGYIAIAVQ